MKIFEESGEKKPHKQTCKNTSIHFPGRLTLSKDILRQSRSSAKNLDYLPISLSVNAITVSGMDWAVSCPFLFFTHLSIEGQSTLLWKTKRIWNTDTAWKGGTIFIKYWIQMVLLFTMFTIALLPSLIHLLGKLIIFQASTTPSNVKKVLNPNYQS